MFPHPIVNPVWAAVLELTTVGEMLLLALVLYLALAALGRLLKRSFGTHLEFAYRILCIALALYVPLSFFAPTLILERELGAVSAMLGAAVFVSLLDQYLWRWYFEQRRQTPIPKVIRQVVAAVILLLVALLVLDFVYQKSVPGLLAGSGIIAITLGLAMQDALGNIIAGFTLQVGRPFQPGDWLLLDNQHVKAVEINWRSSRFVTNDDVQLDMPNQQIIKQTIVNYHGGGSRHGMRLLVGVEYDAPPNRVKDILAHAAASAQGVAATPAPNVFLKDFGDSSVVYEVRFWLDDHRLYNAASDAVRTNIWYALRRQNVKIPFPVRTLQIERNRNAGGGHHSEQRKATIDILRDQPLFQGVLEQHLTALAERCPIQHYGRGEVIIREGAEGTSMFVLLRGEAGVTVTTNGQATRVATLEGGECFGEMSLLTGVKRSASIIAAMDCEVLEVTKPFFAEVVQREADLLPRLSELLAQRQMETEGILQAKSQPPAMMAAKEQEYKAGFLKKLSSFFEL